MSTLTVLSHENILLLLPRRGFCSLYLILACVPPLPAVRDIRAVTQQANGLIFPMLGIFMLPWGLFCKTKIFCKVLHHCL